MAKREISYLDLDVESFNKEKDIRLFDYQVQAITNTIKFLIEYFGDGGKSIKEYYESILDEATISSLNITEAMPAFEILKEYFNAVNNQISFFEFTNRICYWMATASGKSLIIVKLLEILFY